MEPYGEVGVLMNLGNEYTGSEILKSLLTSSKMQKTEPVEINILPDVESRNQTEEQIFFQIELREPVKAEFLPNNENIMQQIPVTYLTANNQNFTPGTNETLVEPLTYVLRRDVLPDSTRYCMVGNNDPQKIILVQEVDSNISQTVYNDPDSKVYDVKENQMGKCKFPSVWSLDGEVKSCISSVLKHESDIKSDENVKKSKTKKKEKIANSSEFLAKHSKRDEEPSGNKVKLEKKISVSKKPLNKRKNSKLKSKLKTGGRALLNKPKKQVKLIEEEKARGEEREKRNLFELVKLEDNVDQVAQRMKIGCECSDSNCFEGLNPDDVFKHRLNIADLTKAEHDMYLMGVIMASIHNLEETCRHKERIRIRSCYAYQGKKVCLTAFLYLQHVTLYQMKRLRSHLKNHGVSPRIHGNRGRKPANTFSLDIYRRATNFVQNYIEEHCVKTVPNFTTFANKIGGNSISAAHNPKTSMKKENKIKIANKMTSYHLPPECTKRIVHREYKSYCENLKPSQKVMKYSTFTNFLKKQFPNVKFHKREEKRPERVVVKSEETERWKPKDERTEKCEDTERKSKEDQGIDKSIQVDKALVYIPAKTQILINGQRMALHDESGAPQPYYGAADQALVDGRTYNISHMQNSEPYYAIDSTV